MVQIVSFGESELDSCLSAIRWQFHYLVYHLRPYASQGDSKQSQLQVLSNGSRVPVKLDGKGAKSIIERIQIGYGYHGIGQITCLSQCIPPQCEFVEAKAGR